jgi:hypothetical protein
MPALLTVLTTVARLGGLVTSVRAAELQASIHVLVPPQVAHRVRACLGQIVEVLTISETLTPAVEEASAAMSTAAKGK